MKVSSTLCDFCNKPIPIEKKRDILGIEREVILRGKLNYIYKGISIDLHKFGYDCCESCATKIDLNATNFKLNILKL